MASQTLNIKIDPTLKQQFSELAKALGLTSSALVNMFITRTVNDQAVPFELKVTHAPLPPVYQKLWVEEQAIELGLLPDDAEEVTDEEMERWENLYK